MVCTCAAGIGLYDNDGSAKTKCKICRAGYFTDSSSAARYCIPCAAGKHAPNNKSTSCMECDHGTYSGTGTSPPPPRPRPPRISLHTPVCAIITGVLPLYLLCGSTSIIVHAKNTIAGRIIPFLVLGICAGAMPYRRDVPATTKT